MVGRTILLALLVQACVLWPVPLAAASPPDAVVRELAGALDTAREGQKEVDRAAARRAEQLRALDELERRAVWLDYQVRKYDAYIEAREAVLEALHRQEREGGRMRMLLEPALDAACDRLAADVAAGPQFLIEERTARVEAVRAVLKDFDTPLGEKLRRTLEALFIEAQYGAELAATEAVIQAPQAPQDSGNATQGAADGLVRVAGRMLRVGRMACYFLSRDGSRAFRMDATGQWRPMEADGAAQLALAFGMLDRRVLPGLVLLPGADAP
ncbi:MAG: DUF3450 family protein [Desulfovibrionaceae bacterium]